MATGSLWSLGFRPFFLFGSLHALVALAVWIAFQLGWIDRPGSLDPILWHAHEMLFGFTAAIIAGFVLTASQNWTGVRGVNGKRLQLLVFLWILGRVLVSIPGIPRVIAALVDLSFFPLLSYFMIPYLKGPDMKVERVFFLFFGLLFVGNLLVHLEGLEIFMGYGRKGVFLALNTVIAVIVFMGGRVIPFFTESELSRKQPRTWKGVEVASHASVAFFLVLDFFAPTSTLFATVAFITAAIQGIRLCGWQVKRVRRVPLLWVLHSAYLWLALGFLLSGLSVFHLMTKSMAIHAFTVGGLGIMIYGMMSRVALGHTGRRLHPSPWIVGGYVLLNASAIVRVFAPMALPGAYLHSLVLAASLWMIAFAIYLVIYSPMLVLPRADGNRL